jgi:putative transposase
MFGTLNSELLPELPGHLVKGKPTSAPRLSLAELDRAITAFIASTYHVRIQRDRRNAPRRMAETASCRECPKAQIPSVAILVRLKTEPACNQRHS